MIKSFVNISRIIAGLTLIIVSLFLATDPIGCAYFFHDIISFLSNKELAAVYISLELLFIIVEFTIGIALIFRFLVDYAVKANLILSVFYLLISWILALKNFKPSQVCYIPHLHYSSWPIFYITLVFTILSLIIYIFRKYIKPARIIPKYQLSWSLTAALVITLFAFFNYTFMPPFDFSIFKRGVCLKQVISQSQTHAKYKVILYYKNQNDNKIYKFTENSFPWKDTANWVWVKTQVVPLKTKHLPNTCNFHIINQLNQDITDSILSLRSPVLLIIADDLSKTSLHGFLKILKFARTFTDQYFPVAYCLTSSPQPQIDSIVQLTGAYDLEFCHTPSIILKQMSRSNPGIIILKDGQILVKANYNTLPKLKRHNYYMINTHCQ